MAPADFAVQNGVAYAKTESGNWWRVEWGESLGAYVPGVRVTHADRIASLEQS